MDLSSKRACDTVYLPRAILPVLLYWQRTGDPAMAELYLLEKGDYEMTLTNTDDGRSRKMPVTVSGPRTRIDFVIGSRIEYTLKIVRAE